MKNFFHQIERLIDGLIFTFRKALGLKRPNVVIPYLGYGLEAKDTLRVRVLGRVVEESTPLEFSHSTRRFTHILQVVRLFLTRKVPFAETEVDVQKQVFSLNSNEEGFFSEIIEIRSVRPSTEVKQHLMTFCHQRRHFNGRFITPTQETKSLIISDIDDTVLKSHATSFLRLAYRTVFHPIGHRKTFDEASEVYRSLTLGKTGQENNLIFYVSSSTWNLYPLLQGFLELNEFPSGPVILQDVSTERKKNPENSHGHKLDRILEIADFYPELPLTLIGDAGQRDPEIYLEVARKRPGRVRIILIRQSWWKKAIVDTETYPKEASDLGTRLIYFEDLNELKADLKEFMLTE